MSLLTQIFSEYRNKRKNGQDMKSAIEALRVGISKLSEDDKQQLKTQIRTYEKEIEQSGDGKKSTGENPATRITATFRAILNPERAEPKTQEPDSTTRRVKQAYQERGVPCPNCGKPNRVGEAICAHCGHVLSGVPTSSTQQLSEADQDFAFHHFNHKSVLVLVIRDTGEQIELRPQDKKQKELVIGRIVAGSSVEPDVDLTPYGGENQGVSRAHMAVRFNSDDKAIQVFDLGSSNGTFINGRKLHPREVFVLRNGDDIRLGRMVIRANFVHQTDGL